jgi:G protein-coupled receptor 107
MYISNPVLSQETEGERSFERWTTAFHLFDIVCCILVLIVIVWSISALEKNLEQSNGDHNDSDDVVLEDELEHENETSVRHKDGRILAKLQLFRRFYLLVVAYVYCTRIIVYLFSTMLGYKSLWIREFVVEGVTLVFYVLVGR